MTATSSLFSFTFRAMGSPCEMQCYASDEHRAQQIARAAIAEAERLEQRYSRYRDDSVLSHINRIAARAGCVDVDAETAGLLHYADTCYQQSDGLFDITSGLLRQAWNFKSNTLPEPAAIDALLHRIGWHKVQWQSPRLCFNTPMELDFGGIVKEYAADRLATLCWNAGLTQGFINLGGDIRVMGPHPDGSPWRIGIQDPRAGSARAVRLVEIQQGGIASSGDYERCIVINGQRYGHILNPKTGWPVKHLAAVTVIADLCVIAGSAATIAMLKESEGPAWLASLGVRHFWVDGSGNTGDHLTSLS